MSTKKLIAKLIIISLAICFCLIGCKPPNNSENKDPVENNSPPSINSISYSPNSISPFDVVEFILNAEDVDGDILEINWWSEGGSFLTRTDSTKVHWDPQDQRGRTKIYVKIDDGEYSVTDSLEIFVNSRQVTIDLISPVRTLMNYQHVINPPDTASFVLQTPNLNDQVSITWSCDSGDFIGNTSTNSASWIANDARGFVTIKAEVTDSYEAVSETINIYVNSYPEKPILNYPVNNSNLRTDQIAFIWDAYDNDNENLKYNLSYTNNTSFDTTIYDIPENYYVPQVLNDGDNYTWSIESIDNNGLKSEISSTTFTPNRTITKNFDLGGSGELIEMALISNGTYFRGAPNELGAGSDEEPVREITIQKDLWVGVYELTQKQWLAIMGNWNFGGSLGDNLPAVNFTFQEAKQFISALNDFEGDSLWRMPTEAEWEYFCRAGHYENRFFWGNDNNYNLLQYFAWYNINSGNRLHEVGTTAIGVPNPWGLWDTQGNAYEFCEDFYYYDYETAPIDGSAQLVSFNDTRVLRGGCWATDNRRCRAAHRSWLPELNRADAVGIRLVREMDD